MKNMKIPGLAHEVNIKFESGVAMINLSLRGDVIASTPLKSASENGISKGLQEVAKIAEIAHQIPDSILKDVAKRLSADSGFVGETPQTPGNTAMSGGAELSQEVEEKLNLILTKLGGIEKQLKSIEEKWG